MITSTSTAAVGETGPHPYQPAAGSTPAARGLGRVCLLLALVLLACGAGVAWLHRDQVVPALARIGPPLWALGALLTAIGLGLRALRWWWVMRALGHRLPWRLQVRVWMAGLSLSPTPGKVGEAARAGLLRPHGVPVSHTLAAFLCDRGADVIGVALLGAAAGVLAAARVPVLEALAVGLCLGTLLLAWMWRRAADQGRRLPARLAPLAEPVARWAAIWRSGPAAAWVLMSVAAWALQGLLLAALVQSIHGPGGPGAWACVAIYCVATLLGAATLAPSGLGTMDAALVVQLGAAGVATGDAIAIAIGVRLCTLWLAWCAGWLALASFGRDGSAARPKQDTP